MDDGGWWRILLDGTVGAIISGLLALGAALLAVWLTHRHAAKEEHHRALLGLSAQMVTECHRFMAVWGRDPIESSSAYGPIMATAVALRMELAGERRDLTEWMRNQVFELADSARLIKVRDVVSTDPVTHAGNIMHIVEAWATDGFPNWTTEEIQAELVRILSGK